MNIYTHRFSATCPNNGARIDYTLRIKTPAMIQVEDIVAATSAIVSGYHEAIADRLAVRFGGVQSLKAHHHGVHIETVFEPDGLEMGLIPASRYREIEEHRSALHRCIDLYVDNLIDDGREGGSIAEGSMPTVDDSLMQIAIDAQGTA